MNVSLPILQVLALVLAGIVAGGGLLMLGTGWLAKLSRDEAAVGCTSIGTVLLVAAGFIAVRALVG
jgi:hypothetical protein